MRAKAARICASKSIADEGLKLIAESKDVTIARLFSGLVLDVEVKIGAPRLLEAKLIGFDVLESFSCRLTVVYAGVQAKNVAPDIVEVYDEAANSYNLKDQTLLNSIRTGFLGARFSSPFTYDLIVNDIGERQYEIFVPSEFPGGREPRRIVGKIL